MATHALSKDVAAITGEDVYETLNTVFQEYASRGCLLILWTTPRRSTVWTSRSAWRFSSSTDGRPPSLTCYGRFGAVKNVSCNGFTTRPIDKEAITWLLDFPFMILGVLVLFWSVPYADGFQLEMVGALSASLDHHCPSGFLCRASSHGLAQPWLGNASAETDGDEFSSGYLFSSD